MIPHTLVLKPGLVVHSVYNGYWFWGRPSMDDLCRDLRAATSEIRPDWDLTTPGLREAWAADDWSRFPRVGQALRSAPCGDGRGTCAIRHAGLPGQPPVQLPAGAEQPVDGACRVIF